MSVTAAELERTSEIEIDILLNTYLRDEGSVQISADICDYISALILEDIARSCKR